MTKHGGIMTKIKTSNGEVSMRMNNEEYEIIRMAGEVSRVLILTMMFSLMLPQGWYQPKKAEAAIGTLIAPTVASAAGNPANVNVTIGAGSNRIMVVGVSLTTAANTDTPTVAVTYSGTALTPVPNTDTSGTGGFAHTYLFYMLDTPSLMDNTARALAVTVSGGFTTRYSSVWRAVYTGVSQTAPTGGSMNSGTGTAGDTALRSTA